MRKFYATIFNKYRLFAFIISCFLGLIPTSLIFAQSPEVITSSTTWTVPAGVTSVKVEVWGGGGGGGGALAGAGGGGGGGAYKTETITVMPGQTYTITVGSGGIGGGVDLPNFSALTGTAGEISSFTNAAGTVNIFANAGEPGFGGTGGDGGGNIGGEAVMPNSFAGGAGGTGASNGGGGGAGNAGIGGDAIDGGSGGIGSPNNAPFIGGNGGAPQVSAGDGHGGVSPGGGGGGAYDDDFTFQTGHTGGNGGAGQVVLTYTVVLGPPTITSFSPTFGCANTTPVTITGSNLAGATAVTFGGTPAKSFLVDNDGQITAVPALGTTGKIEVTAGALSGTSTGDFTVNPLPTAFNVTGGGAYCSGGTGVTVGLSNSENNVNYQLYRGATAVGAVVPGNGSAISFGLQTVAGTYTVKATNTAGCSTDMTGSAAVSVTPAPNTTFSYSNSIYCATGTSVTPTLAGAPQTGAFSSTSGLVFSSTSTGVINLAASTPGTYDISYKVAASGGCSEYIYTQPTKIVINAVPAIFNVLGSGTYCSTTGGEVTLSGSENGVNYQLLRGGTPVGSSVAGDGTPISLGLQTVAGTYTVSATTGTCNRSMTGNAVITITPQPNTTFTYSNSNYCAVGTSVAPTLSGAPTNGTFSSSSGLVFSSTSTGVINLAASTPGTYDISYTVAASGGCGEYIYTQPTKIVINAVPALFNVLGSGTYCSTTGGEVTLSGSETGVSYQLYRGATAVSTAVPGTGSAISFGLQTIAGTYTVKSSNSTCDNDMNGSAVITITPQPNTTFTYPNNTYCAIGTSSAATLVGSPQTGTFFSTPSGVNFLNANTGVINLATSTPGTYDIGYKVAASGGCAEYIYTQPTQVKINAVPAAFNVIGTGTYCSTTGGEVKLDGSETGVTYKLFRGGTQVGSPVPGNGSPITFGLQTVAGTYTVTATTGTCDNTMTGSAVIAITTQPTTTFTYSTYTYCATSTSGAATLSGAPTTGTFSSSPVGVIFSDPNSGNINLGSTPPGTYSIIYTVNAAGCATYTYTQPNSLVIKPNISLFTVSGGGTYCSTTGGDVKLSGSQTGVNYQLLRGGVAVGSVVAGMGSALDFGFQTTAGTYTVTATNGTCSGTMTGNAVITITAAPTTTFTYSNYNYCKIGSSPAATLSGAPQTGTFSSTPSGVNFSSTGVINLATSPAGTYSINYVIAASACPQYTYTQPTKLLINAVPTASAGADIVSCSVPIQMTGATATGTYSSVAWSGAGALGTFSGSGNDPSTYVFTPSASAPQGSFTATLTVTAAAPCTGTITSTRKITWGSSGSWLGIVSTDWFNANNWCGGVPTAASDVIIPAVGSVPNQPIIGAAGAVCRSITLNGTLGITGTNNLDVYGSWTNNGTFTANTSSVTFRGGTGNTLAGSSATTFYNLIVNKSATANTLTSTTKAFATTNLSVTQGNLILTANDVSYNVNGNITVPTTGILTDNVNWDGTHLLSVTGNIAIDGIFNYTSGTPHVNMNGAGTKTVRSGSNPASGFGFLTLSTGTYSASGNIVVNSNFWAMFGTPGSFSTNGQTITAKAGLFIHGGTVNINGGTLNVTGGMSVGYPNGLSGVVNFTSGTLNADALTVGPNTPAVNGVFNQSGGVTNIGNLLINNTTTASSYICTGSPVINITGSWTNNETAATSFAPATSQVNFIGSSAQSINGVATSFYNLNIANAAGVTLGNNVTVNNTLNLSNGLVTTGANVLTMSSAGNITSASATSYINGKLAWTFNNGAASRTFPIGKAGNYRPLVFTYAAISSAPSIVTVDQIEANIGAPTAPVTAFAIRYWNISQSGGNSLSYKVTLNDPDFTPIGPSVKIIKKEGNGTPAGFDATAPNYTNVTAFNTFSGGSDGTNAFTLGYDCSATANAGGALADFCQGGTSAPLGGSISGTATGGIWSTTAGGTFSPSATDLNATWTPPANYYGTAILKLTTTGGLCGNVSDTKTQTVIQGPTGTITPSTTSSCVGSAVTFTATAGSGYSYIFYVNGIVAQSSGSNNLFSPTNLQNGDVVTVTISNANNCGITLTAPAVAINPLPTATLIASGNNICPGTSVTFTATGGSGAHGYTFLLNGNPTQSGSGNTYTTTTLADHDKVSVIVKDANGCSATYATPIEMTVNPVPTGTLSSNPTPAKICAGDNITFTATPGFDSYEFFVNNVSQGTQTGSNDNIFSSTTLANASAVKVTATNGSGCFATFNAIGVIVNPLPTATITTTEASGPANDNIICSGAKVTFTATSGFNNYKFYLRGTGVPVYNGSSNKYEPTNLVDGDFVTVVVTNNNSCVSSAEIKSAVISVVDAPTGTLTVSPSNTICANDQVTFTADPGFTNYNFKINGVSKQNGSSNTFAPTAGSLNNNNVITVDVRNSNSCVSTFNSVTMHVNPLPTGTMAIAETAGTPNDGIICTGTTVIFTAPAGFTTYNFLLNGSPAPGQDGTKTYTTSTLVSNDKVTVSVTNSTGCSAVLNSYTITVNLLPNVAAIGGPDAVCVGSTITLTNEDGGGKWSSGDNSIATIDNNSGELTGVAAGPVTITYIFTNSNGCSSSVTKSITVNDLPAVAPITGNFNICTGYTAQFNDETTGGVWSSSNTAVANVSSTGEVSGLTDGTATITYTFTNANGCSSAVSQNIIVSDLLHVSNITTTAPAGFNVCIGSSITVKDNTPGGTWSIDDNSVATISSTGVVTAVAPGTATITYSVSTTCGQNAETTQEITVNAKPSASISYGGTPYCKTSDPVDVTFSGTAGGTFSSTTGLIIDAVTGSITPASSTPGTYTVTYTVAAAGGCSVYTTTTSVTITAAPSATISYGGSPFCSTSGPANVTLSGTTGGTFTSTAGLSIAANGTIAPSTSTAGTYTVTYTVAADGGCALYSTTTEVTITAAPSATISYAGTPFCSNGSGVTVTQTGTPGGTYSYTGTGSLAIATNGTITPSSSDPGTYNVVYTVAAANGCALSTFTTSVKINAAPTAAAGLDLSTCSNTGAANITTGSSATNYSSIVWTSSGTGTFANANSLTNATYNPSGADITAGSVTLTLTVNGNAGCSSISSTKNLTINPIPTISILPLNTTLCQGSIQALVASSTGTGNTTIPKTFQSGNINLTIPDATRNLFGGTNPGDITTPISITGIPNNANITNVSITLNVTHPNDGDLNFNIISNNGKILNLINRKGGSGNNFTGTTIAWNGGITLPDNGAPYTGIFKADANGGIGEDHGWFGNDYRSNVNDFSNLLSLDINGTWQLYAEDAGRGDEGKINSWSITIEYTVPESNPVIWSPQTDLYTDAGATTPYTGQSLTTVYAKPSTSGTKIYTATASNAQGCTNTAQSTLIVEAAPDVKITADYCAVAGKVVLTASSNSIPTGPFKWDNGKTQDTIQVDEAGDYSVTLTNSSGCKGYATISVANEKVINGNFDNGNNDFNSDYAYREDLPGVNNELVPDNDNLAYSITTSGQNVHNNFWGYDHTTGDGTGKFMAVNGHGDIIVVWKQTVNVLPNTTYYFSAWAMSLNSAGPFAKLRFSVNGQLVGTTATLQSHCQNCTPGGSNDNWSRFYGTWTSGPNQTTADIYINDLEASHPGNDFALDDISFGTLSTFITLESAPGTDAQKPCVNSAITPIVYSVGSTASGPTVTPLPAGVTSSWNGVLFTISGTPTVPGTYSYTVTTTGNCKPSTATGTITVQEDKISLSSGNASPSVCTNSPVNIGFTLSGTATDVISDSTKIPDGFTGSLSGTTYTITGQSATPGVYPYTIVTSGGCTSDTVRGTITVTAQTVTLNTGNDNQTLCINTPLEAIQYTVGGTGTNATVTGLPAGVSFSPNDGIVFITGKPTEAGDFTYTVTTSGTCEPATIQGMIHVTPAAALALTSPAGTDDQILCINNPIAPISYSVSNATTATISGLPVGVTGQATGGIFNITGAPTEGGTFNYTITTTDGCGTATISGKVTVNSQTITLSGGSSSPTVCENVEMGTPITFTIGGTANDATVAGLPSGMEGSLTGNTFTITGTPTESGSFDYTVTVSGSCSTDAIATGTITVAEAPEGGTIASVAVCAGTTSSLTLLDPKGTIDHWEVSTDEDTWTNIVNTGITQNFTNVMTTTYYRAAIKNTCGAVYSTTAKIAIHNLWTGKVSIDWNDGDNWSDGNTPSAICPDVYIPGGTIYQPTLGSGTASVTNLHIHGNGFLIINNATLQIKGIIDNTGTFDATQGTLEFNGTTQSISGSMFNKQMIGNLKISNNSVTIASDPNHISDTLKVGGLLSFGSASGKLITNDNLTLLSTKDSTASVGPMASGNSITGKVEVERFIRVGTANGTHGKSWQFLATPTGADGTGQTLKNSWMEGGTSTESTGYGAQFVATLGHDGYDGDPTPGASVKFWDETIGNWTEKASANDLLYNVRGYFAFVRGDRSVNGITVTTATPTTLRSKGNLAKGLQTFTVPASTTNHFYSIGNPFVSAVDLTSLHIANTEEESIIYIWNPSTGGNYGVGGWITATLQGGHYIGTPGQVNLDVLESGQAFMVQTAGAARTITIDEQNKVTGSSNTYFREQGDKIPGLSTTLLSVDNNHKTLISDGTLQQFDKKYSNQVNTMDGRKILNGANNLYLKVSGSNVIVERRAPLTEQDTIQYNMSSMAKQNYRLEFKAQGLSSEGVDGFIEDTYLNTRTPLNMEGTTHVDFAVTNDKGTYAADRFRIVFKTAVVLPVKFVSVTAVQQEEDIEVAWKTENEKTVKQYDVEKSVDGVSYKKAYTVAADNNGAGSYQWLDEQAAPGDNFYRIRVEDESGKITYSAVVKVAIPFGKPSIGIYPNPITDGIIHLQFVNQPKGRYGLRLLNPLGQTIVAKQIEHAGGNATEDIKWNYHLAHGVYQLQVLKPDGKTKAIKVIY